MSISRPRWRSGSERWECVSSETPLLLIPNPSRNAEILDQIPVLNEENQIVGVIRALDIMREWVEETLETELDTKSIHTTFSDVSLPRDGHKVSAESMLAKIKETEQARLRIYIGAAAGVGKTFQMLEEAHALASRADLLLCVGSSLEVYPVASLPAVTTGAGGALAIITQGPTPYDSDATVRLGGDVVDELGALLEAL